MKVSFSLLILWGAALSSALPQSPSSLIDRDTAISLDARDNEALWKRKGGGGGGGARGGGGSSSGTSGGRGGGTTGTGSTGGSSRGGSGSSTGGRTSSGSGPAPSYGRTSAPVYGGGAAVPYSSGTRMGGVSPFLIGGIGAAAIFPGLWLYSVYAYPYSRPWYYYNRTANRNESKPVQCFCAEGQSCGCEENNDTDYQRAVLGDGSYTGLNKSLVTVANVNGTDTILLNGTLPNGTTAAGGTDDDDSAGVSLARNLMQASGYWVMAATVGAAAFLL